MKPLAAHTEPRSDRRTFHYRTSQRLIECVSSVKKRCSESVIKAFQTGVPLSPGSRAPELQREDKHVIVHRDRRSAHLTTAPPIAPCGLHLRYPLSVLWVEKGVKGQEDSAPVDRRDTVLAARHIHESHSNE
ncbi:Hypothetical predicted protein [Scomber scombrus]|uniref:Uncharacterized protein n=1 Tax=Scomber scombrus TaxID=13677 RepID=A0AAV1PXE5_SCOSC